MITALPFALLLTLILKRAQTLAPNSPFIISNHQFEYLRNFFQRYEDFGFVVHFDYETRDAGNALLAAIAGDRKFVSSFNGDYQEYGYLKTPSARRYIHLVVYKNPRKFQPYLLIERNVVFHDVLIFLIYNGNELRSGFWNMNSINNSGRILIVVLTAPESVLVYKKCYYCGRFSNSLQLLENTTEVFTKIIFSQIHPSEFKQFNGHPFNVGYLEFFPHMYCTEYTTKILSGDRFNQCVHYSGGEAELVKVLSWKLNFTFDFVYDVQNSVNILENLLKRKFDFAIGGLSVTYERFKKLTFSTSLRMEDVTTVYMYERSIWGELNLFVRPFSGKVWLVIFVTLSVILILLWKTVGSKKRNVGFGRIFLVCLKTIVEQNDSKISTALFKTRWGPFILFFSLMFACMEINTAYKSKLSSIFVRPPHKEPHSIEELIADGYDITVDGEKLDFYSEMLSSTDPILIFLKKKGILLNGFCSQIEYISKHRAAMMNEWAILQYYVRYMCPDDVYPRVKTGRFNPEKMRITNKPVRSNPHAWMLQPGVPYWKTFDIIIGKLKNGGFLDKWTRDALMDLHSYTGIPNSKNNFPENDDYSSLNTYSSSFLIYAIGITASFLAFGAELLYFTLRKPKEQSVKKHEMIMFTK